MIEPYLLNIGLEILKMVGGILVPLLTIIFTIYANKFKKSIERNQVKGEVDRLVQWALQAKSFQTMKLDDRIGAIMESARLFMAENNITMTNTELTIMIENSLAGLKKLEAARYKINRLRKLEEQDGLEKHSTE